MKFASFLAAQAQTLGDKDALVCGDRRMTFAQLEHASNQVALALQRMGVAPGERIALYLPNCVEFPVAFFGIVKAGAIAVPLNMRLALPEIRFMLEDSAPSVAIISGEHAAAFQQAAQELPQFKRIVLGAGKQEHDYPFETIMQGDAGPLRDIPPHADDCMISYTSGTTGKPKGAILTQANYIVMNGFLNAIHWGFSSDDRILITTPLAHRTAFARLGNMVVLGATLVILPKFDAPEVARIIEAERITVLGMVPTVGKMLMPEIERAPQRFASLKRVLATGEAFPVGLKAEMLERLPHIRLYSFFSMTEAGVVTLLKPEQQFSHPSSVGRVLPGIEVRLVDEQGNEAAPGAVGELWVRTGEPGRYLTMKGYFNQPQATAESLRNGWFATGDMARIDADGYVYIVDRKKDMILSGGYNIYSKEVENTLCAHPAVADAAVIGVPDDVFGEAVAAFVIRKPGAEVQAETLIDWCVRHIASYKKPKHLRFVESLPQNSTGKVVKRELHASFCHSITR
jgi:long-chain acyl-CoA synthetase